MPPLVLPLTLSFPRFPPQALGPDTLLFRELFSDGV